MKTLALSLLNGERAVVVCFISLVLFSTPLSLIYEAFCLSLLSLFALSVEILVEDSVSVPYFKTRLGASSGILLGAVTLPGVLSSRLIQLTRAYSLEKVGVQELEYLRMQYWATCACCIGVLISVGLIMKPPHNNRNWFCMGIAEGSMFSLGCVLLSIGLCCASLAALSHSGGLAALKLLWIVCHGLAAVKLIKHILITFPSCASIGEALLVTSGLVLYFGDMMACTIEKSYKYSMSSALDPALYEVNRSEISTFIQGMLLGILLFSAVYKFVLQIREHLKSSAMFKAHTYNDVGKSIIFYTSLVFILLGIVPLWMQFVQDFQMHPLLWVLKFVFTDPLKRLSLCIYWVGVIYVSVLRFYNISKSSKVERILLRKYYHLMAVCMFVPALIYQPKFLDLAFGAALAIFLVLEIIRVWRIWPLGQLVHQFMNAFTDHRDSDLLIVSHFSLLLGCALPIWMSSEYNDRPLAPFAGILSLGIGDTMASMVGYKYGVLRWSKTGKKTIEGTAAGITSVLAACSVLLPLLASTGYILSQHWLSLLLAVIVSGLLEAYTAQLDNAFIPLIFYSLLCL